MRPVLSGKTDLAVRLLRLLASDGLRHKGQEIATALCTTSSYVPHVAQPLIRAGWVASTAGPHGGYQLVVDRNELSLLDVIETVEGPLDDGRCVLREQACPGGNLCVLHEPWSAARATLLEALRSTPIDVPDEDTPLASDPDQVLPDDGQVIVS